MHRACERSMHNVLLIPTLDKLRRILPSVERVNTKVVTFTIQINSADPAWRNASIEKERGGRCAERAWRNVSTRSRVSVAHV